MSYRFGKHTSRRKKEMTYKDIKQRTAAMSKRIDNYLKTIRSGGGRLESWQGKYPVAGSTPWDPSNNITKYPQLAQQAFYPPGQRGGKRRTKRRISRRKSHKKRRTSRRRFHSTVRGGAYHIPESYFGRSPVGYVGPKSTPYPSLKQWQGIS